MSTIGVAFFGTPHRGGATPYVSWGTLATNIVKVAGFDVSRKILRELEVDSGYLEILRDEFQKIVHERKILIHTFQESYGVKGIRGLNGKVVSLGVSWAHIDFTIGCGRDIIGDG